VTVSTQARPLSVPIRAGAPVDAVRPSDSASSPWAVGWLLALIATTGLGLAAIVTAWYGASGRGVFADQVPWLNHAVGGAIVAGLGNCAWLLRGRRSVGELRRSLLVAAPVADDVSAPSFSVEVAPAPAVSAAWVQAKGMRKVHRPSCPMVVGKTVRKADISAGDACAICSGAAQ
jgi:hypothetical protein